MAKEDIKLLYIDLFCGAGGTSTGVEKGYNEEVQTAKVIACVNHDFNAIASHKSNHPDALHFVEDIRTLEMSKLIPHINLMRFLYPEAKLVLWASLECTNFSKAKGGQPRDADSRTLAEHLFRYIEAIDPDYIQIENVEEFMSWGDLDEKGKPISSTNGTHYKRWVSEVESYGYDYDFRILNAADFGAYTSRKRFFGIFAKQGLPISWPSQTHSKTPSKNISGNLLKNWKPVKDCLDLSDEGESIFGRKKPLVEATLNRLYSGLIKFVAGGKDKWMLKYNSVNGNTGKHNPPDLDNPCPTISCQGRLGLVQTSFLSKYFSGHPDSKNISVEGPAHTITGVDHHSLVKANFIAKYYSGNPEHMVSSINDPAATLRTKDCQSLISTSFLSAYYGNGHNHSLNSPSPVVTTKDRLAYVNPKFLCSYNYKDQAKSLDAPCPTLLTKDRLSLISPIHFMDQQYGKSKPASISKPLGALTANPKYNLVQCDSWLMNTNFGNVGSSLENPAPVITANRKWHYLMNPQYKSAGGSVDKACFTLIARMDKMPPYLIEASSGSKNIPSFVKIIGDTVIYEIYEDDSPTMKKIKEFMAVYQILDIMMRMLRIPELKMIMGFPKNYKLIGTQAEQKKYIGNAVEVTMARVIRKATVYGLENYKLKSA